MDVLRFEQLTCELGKTGRRVVASGAVPENGVLVVRGPSGAGKSTLLRALARLRPILHGRVWLQGREMREVPPTLWRRRVHYVAQQPVAFDGTVLDNLLLPYRLRIFRDEPAPQRPALVAALEELGLPDPDQDARTLSGGELARVALLRAVLARPSVLLLDEPTASLDAANRQRVVSLLRRWVTAEPGRGLVLVSHADQDAEAFGAVRVLNLPGQDGEAQP